MEEMPVLFVGHGSPMDAIEENPFVEAWRAMGRQLPKPRAILSVSAHWFTRGLRVLTSEKPRTIHDIYGFPDALYQITYPAQGDPELAAEVLRLLEGKARGDDSWGLDHGTWSVLSRMYPEAEVPTIQLSVDQNASAEEYYQMGKRIAPLRKQGVLLLGSGNVVHNLRLVDWETRGGFPWAEDFDGRIEQAILAREDARVIRYREWGRDAALAVPTPDHFAPLLFILGAAKREERVTVWNRASVLGSLSMTSYLFEAAKKGEQP